MAKDFTDIFVIVLIFVALIGVVAGLVNNASSQLDVANETVTGFSNTTEDELANDRIVSGSVILINSTDAIIPASNYTVNLNAGTVILTSPSKYVGDDGEISYTVRADLEGAAAIVVGLIVIVVSLAFMRKRAKDMKGGRR